MLRCAIRTPAGEELAEQVCTEKVQLAECAAVAARSKDPAHINALTSSASAAEHSLAAACMQSAAWVAPAGIAAVQGISEGEKLWAVCKVQQACSWGCRGWHGPLGVCMAVAGRVQLVWRGWHCLEMG